MGSPAKEKFMNPQQRLLWVKKRKGLLLTQCSGSSSWIKCKSINKHCLGNIGTYSFPAT